MAKPRTPNQKKTYTELNKRLSKYMLGVMSIYEKHNFEASLLVGLTDYTGANGEPFSFDNYPQIKDAVSRLKKGFATDLNALIYSGTSAEWMNSNKVQDLLADDVLRAYHGIQNKELFTSYYQNNSEQLKAFQERRDNGMSLSQKIWNQAENYKQGLETSISTALEKGMSAVILSKKVSKYLLDWESLKKDYKERFGTAVDIHDCEYRSMRLARSEINMAYRTAEQTRWQQMDFIVGKEIKLSGSHPQHDICDMLAGKYPKNFKWTGWHPNDLCYEIPILNTEDEFWSLSDKPSVNTITDVPQAMKDWLALNAERVQLARVRGTLPYWIKDNNITDVKSTKLSLDRLGYMPIGYTELTLRDKQSLESGILHIANNVHIFGSDFKVTFDKVSDGTILAWKGNELVVNMAEYNINGSIFRPSKDLLDAIRLLKKGKILNFNQEYAIEALYHESIHSRVDYNKLISLRGFKSNLNEVCTQLKARDEYDLILNTFGVKAINKNLIQTNGYGYHNTCKQLRPLFTKNDKFKDIVDKIALCECDIKESFVDMLTKDFQMSQNEIASYIYKYL